MPELPELINSPIFLAVAAIFAIFIIIGIIKHAWRFLIWIVIIAAVLFYFGVVREVDLRECLRDSGKWWDNGTHVNLYDTVHVRRRCGVRCVDTHPDR